MVKREMTISYKPEGELLSGKRTPYLRLGNQFMAAAGFQIGDKVNVRYEANKITIEPVVLPSVYQVLHFNCTGQADCDCATCAHNIPF